VRTTFNWFTGVASIAAQCPPGLRGKDGLRPFYANPNNDHWGSDVPRWLYHESLHYWQLVSSSYLQKLVAAEWARVLAFEADGKPPPSSPMRTTYARPAPGEPFSVRELVECLARFWDVLTRGAHRLMKEEGDTLDGRLQEIEIERRQRGHDEQSQWEFDAIMSGGRDRGIYGAPYVWMKEQAQSSSRLSVLGKGAESWAVTLFLPIAGRLALNTESPIGSFITAFNRVLATDVLDEALRRRDPDRSVHIDWLSQWNDLEMTMYRALDLDGLFPVGETTVDVLSDHPVYRYLRNRVEAIEASIGTLFLEFQSGRIPHRSLTWAQARNLPYEVRLAVDSPWAVLALPGQPAFRWFIGGVLAPPLTRFLDAEVLATRSAFPTRPWPITAEELAVAVFECEARHGALHRAEAALKFGLPQDAFAAGAWNSHDEPATPPHCLA
jgi:hypothetical protein